MQEASTRKIYDVHAMFYDATFGRLVRRRIARAISHMPIRESDTILDLGIGTGVSLDYYPLDRGRIIGVDLSSGMLRKAREKIRERQLSHANVFQADALRLPFAEGAFDYVMCSLFTHHFRDDTCVRVLKEMARVAGRRVYCIDLHRHPVAYYFYTTVGRLILHNRLVREDGALSILRSFRPAELRRLGERAGLKEVKVERRFPYRLVLSASV